MIIATHHLMKTYSAGLFARKPIRVLRDVSLEIQEGEIYVLLGLNGAGKTTLTKLLLDLIRPTSGTALLFGKPVADGAWKSTTGYLPECFRVWKSWTPEALLFYTGRLSGLRTTELRKRLELVLAEVELSDVRNRAVGTFSKGMVQRLGIAQAILHRPRLLLLDEPTEGLDPLGRKWVRELLIHLRASGVSILLNSHLLSEAELVADRIGILHRGTLLVQGSLRELLPSSPHYLIEVMTNPGTIPGWTFRQTETGWACSVSGIDALDHALRQFGRIGIAVRSVMPVRATLEELFTKYIS